MKVVISGSFRKSLTEIIELKEEQDKDAEMTIQTLKDNINYWEEE